MPEYETNAAYHADDAHVGSSMLSNFRESPALYRGLYVTHTIPKPPPTPAMLKGSAMHTLVLEPQRFEAEYLVAPGSVLTRRGKKWEAISEVGQAEGKAVLLAAEHEAARHMAESLRRNRHLRGFLESAHTMVEQSIRWTDVASGIDCKCRPDLVDIDPELPQAWQVELKSSKSPGEEFAKACANYGYDRQMAHNLEGVASIIDRPVMPYFFVVRNEPPWDVWPENQVSQEYFIESGFRSRRYWLTRLAECIKTDVWTSPEQTEPGELKLPPWHLKGAEYE